MVFGNYDNFEKNTFSINFASFLHRKIIAISDYLIIFTIRGLLYLCIIIKGISTSADKTEVMRNTGKLSITKERSTGKKQKITITS